MPATFEEFQEFVKDMASSAKMQVQKLHDHVIQLKIASGEDVVRVIYMPTSQIGLSFHVGLVPSDAVQLYQFSVGKFPDIALLDCYYENANGQTFTGLDAKIMEEQEAQSRLVKAAEESKRRAETEDWELKKMQRSGKLVIH